ncbi:MAG TPA: NAD-dependent succinate-semialdehyde dehydrogenase [Acidimicrobiales bacterium]|nr:NAD-dependent succinate-semialdehyde dehydrogenase [Acidimicrobiales bacterium]
MTAHLSDHERKVLAALPSGLLIGGEWGPAGGSRTFAVQDPATEQEIARAADATPDDARAALDAAAGAQAQWAASAPRDRGEILRRAYELMMERVDELALVMTLEMGKPLGESRAEVAYSADFFRWFSEEAVRAQGDYKVSTSGQNRVLVMRQPVGPCLLITPWNFPAAMVARKVGPAIAAGCTMVLKPPQLTPLSSLAIAGILMEVGLPAGVLNVVTSSSARSVTEPLLQDGRLRKMSFTGSTEVGSSLMAGAAQHILRVSLELGGNAPFLVFEDAELEAAVEGALAAKMRNMGEACTAANRFYVHSSLAAEFTERLAGAMGAMKVGRGTEPGVAVGPLIDGSQRQKVADLVDEAVAKGAKVRCGGALPPGPGYFYEPTVLSDVPIDAELSRTEIFGPVAPIFSFDDDQEALDAANGTEFGLVAYAYTRDLSRAMKVAESLEVGMLGLNRGMVSDPAAPFGGVKESGMGREGGDVGIDEYLEVKYVSIAKTW